MNFLGKFSLWIDQQNLAVRVFMYPFFMLVAIVVFILGILDMGIEIIVNMIKILLKKE